MEMFVFGVILNVALAALGFYVAYLVIRAAVRDGVMQAHVRERADARARIDADVNDASA